MDSQLQDGHLATSTSGCTFVVHGGAVVDKLHDFRQDWSTLLYTHPERTDYLLLWSTLTGAPSLTQAQA